MVPRQYGLLDGGKALPPYAGDEVLWPCIGTIKALQPHACGGNVKRSCRGGEVLRLHTDDVQHCNLALVA